MPMEDVLRLRVELDQAELGGDLAQLRSTVASSIGGGALVGGTPGTVAGGHPSSDGSVFWGLGMAAQQMYGDMGFAAGFTGNLASTTLQAGGGVARAARDMFVGPGAPQQGPGFTALDWAFYSALGGPNSRMSPHMTPGQSAIAAADPFSGPYGFEEELMKAQIRGVGIDWSAGMAGAGIGSAIGSAILPFGGSLVGGVLGYMGGSTVGSWISDPHIQRLQEQTGVAKYYNMGLGEFQANTSGYSPESSWLGDFARDKFGWLAAPSAPYWMSDATMRLGGEGIWRSLAESGLVGRFTPRNNLAAMMQTGAPVKAVELFNTRLGIGDFGSATDYLSSFIGDVARPDRALGKMVDMYGKYIWEPGTALDTAVSGQEFSDLAGAAFAAMSDPNVPTGMAETAGVSAMIMGRAVMDDRDGLGTRYSTRGFVQATADAVGGLFDSGVGGGIIQLAAALVVTGGMTPEEAISGAASGMRPGHIDNQSAAEIQMKTSELKGNILNGSELLRTVGELYHSRFGIGDSPQGAAVWFLHMKAGVPYQMAIDTASKLWGHSATVKEALDNARVVPAAGALNVGNLGEESYQAVMGAYRTSRGGSPGQYLHKIGSAEHAAQSVADWKSFLGDATEFEIMRDGSISSEELGEYLKGLDIRNTGQMSTFVGGRLDKLASSIGIDFPAQTRLGIINAFSAAYKQHYKPLAESGAFDLSTARAALEAAKMIQEGASILVESLSTKASASQPGGGTRR